MYYLYRDFCITGWAFAVLFFAFVAVRRGRDEEPTLPPLEDHAQQP